VDRAANANKEKPEQFVYEEPAEPSFHEKDQREEVVPDGEDVEAEPEDDDEQAIPDGEEPEANQHDEEDEEERKLEDS